MLKFEPVCISCSKEILGCLGQTIACYMFGAVNGASFALPTTVNSGVQRYRLVGICLILFWLVFYSPISVKELRWTTTCEKQKDGQYSPVLRFSNTTNCLRLSLIPQGQISTGGKNIRLLSG